jgi:hypothetical protein
VAFEAVVGKNGPDVLVEAERSFRRSKISDERRDHGRNQSTDRYVSI